MKCIKLIRNDLTSFDQLRTCTGMLVAVKELVIQDNPICKGTILRPFVAFTFPSVITFNGEPISEAERRMGAELFDFLVNKPMQTNQGDCFYSCPWISIMYGMDHLSHIASLLHYFSYLCHRRCRRS